MDHLFAAISIFWHQLLARPSGPLAFRFILQPLMAVALAVRDGIKDARSGRPPYFWTMQSDRTQRIALLKEGVKSLARLLVLTALVDVIYQIIVFRGLRPLETVVITLVLAFLPYLILRGPVDRIMKRVIQTQVLHRQPTCTPFPRDATTTADPGARDTQRPRGDTD